MNLQLIKQSAILPRMARGKILKDTQKRLRLKDAEVCVEAGVSIGTLARVYADHPRVTDESVNKVIRALEALRNKFALVVNNSKSAG